MSLVVTLVVIPYHSLPPFVIRCHSLSFVVTRCHSLSLVVPLVVTRCTTRLSFYKRTKISTLIGSTCFASFLIINLLDAKIHKFRIRFNTNIQAHIKLSTEIRIIAAEFQIAVLEFFKVHFQAFSSKNEKYYNDKDSIGDYVTAKSQYPIKVKN